MSVGRSAATVDDCGGAKERAFLLCLRQALLIALGAIETYLGLERSKRPKERGGCAKKDD